MTVSIRHWILPLIITLICIVVACTGDAGRKALQYLGPEIPSEQTFRVADISYRWLTGHFTHIGWRHVGLNILGLLSIWAVYGQVMRTRAWLVFLLMCPIGISLGLCLLSPQTAYYVGLSGVLHGMLGAAAATRLLMPSRGSDQTLAKRLQWEEIIILTGLWGKIAYEQTIGAVPMTATLAGDTVVVDAHLYGACIGMGFTAALYLFVKCKICKYINLPTSA